MSDEVLICTHIKMFEAWLRDNEPGANHEVAQLTSWEEATKGLEIPQRQPSQETEIER
ncbi:MAG: hypothetical protein H8K07_01045 [Nitrospira sp.]|nr:hypothetical protein [Nitrospira sp.]